MANLKVLRTNGTVDEFIKESESPVIHLILTNLDNKIAENHEIGDVLCNQECNTRFALVVKETVSDKICVPALRVAIIRLLKQMLSDDIMHTTIVISSLQFSGTKEQNALVCTLKEFLMESFAELYTEDMNLVICSC